VKPDVARCSVLVLSEDSGRGAHETLASLAKKMFLFIDSSCQTQHIRFEPPEHEGARQALRGNLWKSRELRDQPRRRDLIGYIATKLCEGSTSFVLFHVDGDRPYSKVASGLRGSSAGVDRDAPAVPSRAPRVKESENVEKFRQFIEREVIQFIEHRRRRAAEMRSPSARVPLDPFVPEMGRLLVAVPYYSIEAWLFQNIDRARDLCLSHPRCRGAHVPLLEAWARDRGLLDEVEQPKEQMCFRDAHNATLAGPGFPTEAVYDAGKSFAETIDRLVECPMLLAALRSTHGS